MYVSSLAAVVHLSMYSVSVDSVPFSNCIPFWNISYPVLSNSAFPYFYGINLKNPQTPYIFSVELLFGLKFNRTPHIIKGIAIWGVRQLDVRDNVVVEMFS